MLSCPTKRLPFAPWSVSRLPVYRGRRNNVRGALLIKEHLVLDPDDEVPVSTLRLRTVLRPAEHQAEHTPSEVHAVPTVS